MNRRTLLLFALLGFLILMQIVMIVLVIAEPETPTEVAPTPMPSPTPLAFAPWTQTVATDYACLRLDSQRVFDMRTGTETTTALAPQPVSAVERRFPAPDGRHVAYLQGGDLYIGAENAAPQLIQADVHHNEGYSWSADSAYFAFHDSYGKLLAWDIDTRRLIEFAPPGLVAFNGWSWSDQGHALAYVWEGRGELEQQIFLSLAAPETGETRRFEAAGYQYGMQPVWSPDGQYVALEIGNSDPHSMVTIYGRNGLVRTDVAALAWAPPPRDDFGPLWSADSRMLLAWRYEGAFYDLYAYDVDTGTNRLLAAQLTLPPQIAPDERYLALDLERDGLRYITLMDRSGEQRIPLVADADDAGMPDWSPSGDYVAAVWSVGQGGQRELYLTWMRPDGSDAVTIDGDLWDIRDLRWLDTQIAYVTQTRDGYAVELADLETGARRVLAGNLDGVADMAVVENRVQFRALANGITHLHAYHADGSVDYALELGPGIGLNERVRVFWSPDGQTAAVAVGGGVYLDTRRRERLLLADRQDELATTVRDNLTGLGDPLWSPDSRLLAFTESTDFEPVVLSVVDAGGRPVWSVPHFDAYFYLTWMRCAAPDL